jgi:hypothetical protein
MHRISGELLWSLSRYTRDGNLWDRVCEQCKQRTPVFEYEQHETQERLLFGYLCEQCAQRQLAKWLQPASGSEEIHTFTPTDFDIAIVIYETKNDGETLVLTRWSAEQRRRKLQGR